MNTQKLFNFDPGSGLPENIQIGGLPLFTGDLEAMQANALTFNLNAMLAKWSVVISGCEVDQVNTGTKQITVLPGIIQLATDAGDIKVYFSGYTGSYPFSVIPGAVEADDRLFKDGEVKNVGERFGYAIRTSFGTENAEGYPEDLSYNEVYFDPFTDQRAEFIIANMARGRNEFVQNWVKDEWLVMTNTETGKPIVGSGISQLTKSGDFYKGAYFSFMDWGRIEGTEKVLVNAEVGNLDLGSGGSNTKTLSRGNIPRHHHEATGDGGNLEGVGAIKTNTSSTGVETILKKQDIFYEAGSSKFVGVSENGTSGSFRPQMEEFAHSHTINSSVDVDGRTAGGTGLKDNPDAIDLRQPYRRVSAKICIGLKGAFDHYKIRPSFYNGTVRRRIN
jgi:hypothetical protein